MKSKGHGISMRYVPVATFAPETGRAAAPPLALVRYAGQPEARRPGGLGLQQPVAQIKKTRRPGEGTGGSRDLDLTRSIEGMEIASLPGGRPSSPTPSARRDYYLRTLFRRRFGRGLFRVSLYRYFRLFHFLFDIHSVRRHAHRFLHGSSKIGRALSSGSSGGFSDLVPGAFRRASGGEIRGGGLCRRRERHAGVRTTSRCIAQRYLPTVGLAELLCNREAEATAASLRAAR